MATTTARIRRPRSSFESLRRGAGRVIFAEGLWTGTIKEVRPPQSLSYLERKTDEGLTKQGYLTADVETISLHLADNVFEGEADPDAVGVTEVGNRRFFVDITIRDGQAVVEDPSTYDPQVAWQLDQAALLLLNLADALGHVEEEIDPSTGEEGVAMAEGFLEALMDGQFNGERVSFEIYHRKAYTSRSGETVTPQEIEKFVPAA